MVGLSPDAVVAMAHLCVDDVLMCLKGFVVSLSSPLSEGRCARVLSSFSTCMKGNV